MIHNSHRFLVILTANYIKDVWIVFQMQQVILKQQFEYVTRILSEKQMTFACYVSVFSLSRMLSIGFGLCAMHYCTF